MDEEEERVLWPIDPLLLLVLSSSPDAAISLSRDAVVGFYYIPPKAHKHPTPHRSTPIKKYDEYTEYRSLRAR